MSHHPNIELIERVVDALGELVEQLVFLGGSTTTLLMTDSAAPPARASIDVDAIVRIDHLADYHRLGWALRAKEFVEDLGEGAPVCRWRRGELILDVMPTDERILGFGNRWYEHTIENARIFKLPSGCSIRLADAPSFLATKLEAFHGRGGGDFLASEDMEDIIALLDGRPEVVDEISASGATLRRYLAEQIEELLINENFRQALPGHLETIAGTGGRVDRLLERLSAIISGPE